MHRWSTAAHKKQLACPLLRLGCWWVAAKPPQLMSSSRRNLGKDWRQRGPAQASTQRSQDSHNTTRRGAKIQLTNVAVNVAGGCQRLAAQVSGFLDLARAASVAESGASAPAASAAAQRATDVGRLVSGKAVRALVTYVGGFTECGAFNPKAAQRTRDCHSSIASVSRYVCTSSCSDGQKNIALASPKAIYAGGELPTVARAAHGCNNPVLSHDRGRWRLTIITGVARFARVA